MERILTRAVLILGSVSGVFGAALTAQVYPGGMAAPFYWSERDSAIAGVPLPGTGERDLYVFAVFTPEAGQEGVVWSLTASDTTRQLLTTRRFADLTLARYLPLAAIEDCTAPVIRTYVHRGGPLPRGGRLVARGYSGVPYLPLTPYSGTEYELAAYAGELLPEERQGIESYLALRHGVTLDQDEPTHYLSADGTIVWDAQDGRGYRHRIFGIARDGQNGMVRLSGRSTACGGGLLGVVAITDREFYLTLSDDDGPLYLRDGRLGRTWRLQATGSIPSESILEMDMALLHVRLPDGNPWQLLVDTTGTAAFAAPLRIDAEQEKYTLPLSTGVAHLTFGPRDTYTPASEDAFFSELTVLPNPSPEGDFQLRTVLREPSAVVLEVHDATGRLVLRRAAGTAESHRLSGRLPRSGLYLVTLRAGKHARTTKIVVP